MKKQKVKGKGLWLTLSIVFTVLFAFMMIAGPIANSYEAIINMVLHTESFKTIGDDVVVELFKADYADSAAQAAAAQELCKQLEAGGAVLLMNDGALPLAQNAKISLLGQSSVDMIYSGGGSGNMDTSKMKFLKEALEQDGYAVNPTLWSFYMDGAGKDFRRQNAPSR